MNVRESDTLIRRMAAEQHGLVTHVQCRAGGIGSDLVERRLRQGVLQRLSPVVMRLAGAPVTPRSEAMAAVLDLGPDAVLSHESAAALWGLPGFDLRPHHVIGVRPRVRRSSPHLAVAHRPRRLLPHHRTSVDGVPVTTPSRMMFDLAGARRIHDKRLERVVDTALSRNLVSPASLRRLLDDLARKGRPGIRRMRALLEERGPGYRPPESGLEARFAELAARAGLGPFVRQVDVGDDDGWVGRVDFVDRAGRVIVEVDTALHHGSISDRRRDEERRSRLRAAGWCVRVVTGDDLFRRPDSVIEALRTARRPAA